MKTRNQIHNGLLTSSVVLLLLAALAVRGAATEPDRPPVKSAAIPPDQLDAAAASENVLGNAMRGARGLMGCDSDPAFARSRGLSTNCFSRLRPKLPLDRLSGGALMRLDRGGDLVQWPSTKGTPPPTSSRNSTDPSIVAGLDPRVGLNLQLGPDPPQPLTNQWHEAEPHIARDPVNADNLVAVFFERFVTNVSQINSKRNVACGYAVSQDGGLSWSRALVPGLTQLTGGPYYLAADPVAGIDLAGNIYLNTIGAVDPAFDTGAIVLSRSTNGGATFDPPVEIFRDIPGSTFLDKEWMAINAFAQTPTAGRIVVTWTMYNLPSGSPSPITLSYSDDGGRTWSPFTYATPTNYECQGSQPMFLPDGTLVLVYWNFSSHLTSGQAIEMVSSTNAGVNFSAPRLVTPVAQLTVPGIRTGLCMPSAATDRSNGVVYVTYQAQYANAPRIMFTKSANQGVTWTTPRPVSDNPTTAPVFNPAIAVSDDGQIVTVQFYDQRVNPSQTNLVDIFLAQSLDAGNTWQPNVRLTTVSSDVRSAPLTARGYFLGDYQGIAPPNPPDIPAVPIWIDTRSGNADPFITRVGIASQVTFPAWRAARFSLGQIGNPNIAGPGADPDTDGAVNALEYAFGLNPWQNDQPEFSVRLSGSPPSTAFTTIYERLSTASDLTYDWLASADLATWTAVSPSDALVTPNPPRLTETVTSSFGPSTNASQFFRLRVKLNE